MKKLSFATALLASVFAMNAQAYQFEAYASYENTDFDGLEAIVTGKQIGRAHVWNSSHITRSRMPSSA